MLSEKFLPAVRLQPRARTKRQQQIFTLILINTQIPADASALTTAFICAHSRT